MTVDQIVRAAIPGADTATIEHVLWGMTPYPCGRGNARVVYRAASRLRRALASGVTLCDHCHNRAEPRDTCCGKCRAALAAELAAALSWRRA